MHVTVDPDESMHYQDYKEGLMQVEQKVSEYHQEGNGRIFRSYFELTEQLNSEMFCSYADSYPVGQPEGMAFTIPSRLF